jgi:hypothetical protein
MPRFIATTQPPLVYVDQQPTSMGRASHISSNRLVPIDNLYTALLTLAYFGSLPTLQSQ